MSYPRRPFSEVADVVTGKTPPTKHEEYYGGDIPFVKPGDLNKEEPINTSETQVTKLGAEQGKLVPEGAVMVSCIGSLGKVGYAARPLITNQQINTLVFDEQLVHPRFGYHYCRTIGRDLESLASSTTLAIVNKSKFSTIEMPLPPLDEQRHIAATLDRADALRAKRRRAQAMLDDLLRSAFVEMFGDPVLNPKGWPTSKLGTLLDSIDSGKSPKCLYRPKTQDEWGVLKLSAVTGCEFIPIENKALPAGESPRTDVEVKPGDLLFSRKNTHSLVAAAAYVVETPKQLLLPDLLFRLNIKEGATILPKYLWALLTHSGKRTEVQKLASGTSGSMPNISKKRLRSLDIEVPQMELQLRFGEVFDSVSRAKESSTAMADRHDALYNALAQRAFRGELTEPAMAV